MTTREKLNALLNEMGRGAKTKLARHLGVPNNYITRWLSYDDYGVPRDQLPAIAKFLGVTIDYLLDESQEVPLTRKIPVIGRASCGVPNGYYSDDIDYIDVPATVYRKGAYGVRAEGDSMSPRISNGDIVICDPDAEPNNGDIVHYTIADESGIKKMKLSEDGRTLVLLPLNPSYEPITVILDDVRGDIRLSKCTNVIASL